MTYYNQQRNVLGNHIQDPHISHFSLGHDKIPAYSNLKEEEFTLAHSLKEYSQPIIVEKSGVAGGSMAAGECSSNFSPPHLLGEQEAETRQEVYLGHKS